MRTYTSIPVFLALAAASLLAGCATPTARPVPAPAAMADPQRSPSAVPPSFATQAPVTRTIVADQTALARLKGATGVTLQWISWDYRGPVEVTETGGVVHISGEQTNRNDADAGSLRIDGDVVRITSDAFTFRGTITITNTPDPNRQCVLDTAKTGDVDFAVTQGRKYWRLRTFEWCDSSTDYIDIYF